MLNRAVLMGRLTADPDLRQTPNGISVATFSLAVQRNYNKDQTDFINIVAWRQTAEFVSRYFTKGQLVAVEGSIQTRNYTDKNGNKRTAFEVVADQVYFADSKSDSAPRSQASASFPVPQPESFSEPSKGTGFSIGDFEAIEDDDSDLPF